MLAAGIIGIFLIATLVVQPFFSKREQLKKNLHEKTVMLEQMRQLQSEYAALTQKAEISKSLFKHREKGFKLFSFLDQLAGESGIKDRISYMKPSTKVEKNSQYKISRVEMKLDDITLEQLANYLYGVETSKNMVEITKISISKKDKKLGLLTAVMQVETVEINRMKISKKSLLYAAYIIGITGFFLYYLFPSDMLKKYLEYRLSQGNPDISVTIDRVSPTAATGHKAA